MPKLIPVGAMRGNSGFLRRQEPISLAIEWSHDGSLPEFLLGPAVGRTRGQGSCKEERLPFPQGDGSC